MTDGCKAMTEATFNHQIATSAAAMSNEEATSSSQEKTSTSALKSLDTMMDAVTGYFTSSNTSAMAEEPDSDMHDAEPTTSMTTYCQLFESLLIDDEVTEDTSTLELESVMEDPEGAEVEDLQTKSESTTFLTANQSSEPDWVPITMFDPLRNANNPENEFHYFSRLPKELRLEIWKEAKPPPRVFLLKECFQTLHPAMCRMSPAPVPALLQVSQEARMEGLRFYKQMPIGCSFPQCSKWESEERFCYVDFGRDYFTLAHWPLENMVLSKSREPLERLMVPEHYWEILPDPFGWLRQFPALKELTVYRYSDLSLFFDNPENRRVIPTAPNDFQYLFPPESNFRLPECGLNILKCYVERKQNFPAEKLPILRFGRIDRIHDISGNSSDWDEDSNDGTSCCLM